MRRNTFGWLEVTNPDKPDARAMKLTFVDRAALDAAWFEFIRRGYDVKVNRGFKLYRDSDEAYKDAAMFIGERERKY